MAAELADAVLDEITSAFGDEAVAKLQSATLLEGMSRAYRTGHSASLTRAALEAMSVVAPLHTSEVDIGLDDLHPVIFLSEYVKSLATMQKLHILTGGQPLKCLTSFWERFHPLRPEHPVYELEPEELALTIPVYLIADEGRGYKKSAIYVLASEPVLGFGCHTEDSVTAAEELKMNFIGNTYRTRQLFSVLPKNKYSNNPDVLHRLVEAWATDLALCFESGIDAAGQRVRIAVVGMKADWPALVSLGKLDRHFRREAYPAGKGICHLCMGNTPSCATWHEVDFESAPWVASMQTSTLPWKPEDESALTRLIQMEPHLKPWFYLPDLFHTVHKGVGADLAGSSIDSLRNYSNSVR